MELFSRFPSGVCAYGAGARSLRRPIYTSPSDCGEPLTPKPRGCSSASLPKTLLGPQGAPEEGWPRTGPTARRKEPAGVGAGVPALSVTLAD